jgi:2-amino-4-hydroxy-6-hydroxymethyldihydropteridine diphosphokinase
MKGGIFLLLGSNQGQADENLLKARYSVEQRAGIILRSSSVYRTEAWGNTDQPDFYNQVLEIDTTLEPHDLLSTVLKIENELGRIRTEKWGPRIIDIDILLYKEKIIDSESLSVPHPGIPFRRFTLVPLNEIASDVIHPGLKKNIKTLLADCSDVSDVKKADVRYS